MKGFIRKLGITTAWMAILGIALNAQVADFEYFSPCEGSVTKFVSTSTVPAGIDTYVWSFGDGSSSANGEEVDHTFPQEGFFFVTLEIYSNSVLLDSESKNVVIYPAPQPLFEATSACRGSWTKFTNNSPIAVEDVYEWNWDFGDGETDESVSPNHFYPYANVYTVNLSVETVNGCIGSFTKDVKVYNNPSPDISVADNDLCYGDEAHLGVSNYASSVLWSSPIAQTTPGLEAFAITVTDLPVGENILGVTVYKFFNEFLEFGFAPIICDSAASTVINVRPNPVIALSYTPEIVVPGGSVTLSAPSEDEIEHWVWTSAFSYDYAIDSTVMYVLYETTEFFVEATDIYGCKVSGSIEVDVDLKPNNIITPNGDGKNDVWFAATTELDKDDGYELIIYNRWGEEVLNQQGYSNDWDGTSNGDQLPEGTYYYVIKHNDITYTGPITLLR